MPPEWGRRDSATRGHRMEGVQTGSVLRACYGEYVLSCGVIGIRVPLPTQFLPLAPVLFLPFTSNYLTSVYH